MLLWRRLFLPQHRASFPPVTHISKDEVEEGLALTSLSDDEGASEETMPSGSWTPHILTSEDNTPASLKMSRCDTNLSDCEDHGPPTSLEKRKSAYGSLQLDFEYISAIKHLLGRDGFEPIKDTVQDQLQCLRAQRETDVHQTHLAQRNGKTQWEGDPTVTSEKVDVRVRVKDAVSFTTPTFSVVLGHVPLCHLSLLSCITMSHCVMHHLSHFVMPQSLSPITCPAARVMTA